MYKKRILIISDIHGNKEALETIDKFIKKTKVDVIICLGDIVGYGVDFKWCLDWINRHEVVVIKGNHESMMLGETSTEKCSAIAKQSFNWTYSRINKEVEEQLRTFKDTYVYDNMLFTHAGEVDIVKWRYIEEFARAKECFSEKYKINFFGHTHRACIIKEDGTKIELTKTQEVKIVDDKYYYINPGSVGQNRGKKTRVSFMVLETDVDNITLKYYSHKYRSYKAYTKILSSDIASEIGTYLIREEKRRKMYNMIYKITSIIRRKKY